MWEVELPDRDARVRCETLGDARPVAYLYAARKRPCDLIVGDGYDQVVRHEHVTEDRDSGGPRSGFKAT